MFMCGLQKPQAAQLEIKTNIHYTDMKYPYSIQDQIHKK